jgi:regulator of replication initiation timing
LKPRTVHFSRSLRFFAVAITFGASALLAPAQQTASVTQDSDLTDSVRQLREQIQELRTAVSEIRSESAQYRAENQELRNELERILAKSSAEQNRPAENASAAQNNAAQNNNVSPAPSEQRVSSLEESTQVMQSELRTLYQTKVESASKYRVRLSGLVLLNLFHNRGEVDNFDVPTYAAPTGPYGVTPGFGATVRQSEFGLEVFGPELAGAKTRGEIQLDFGGGFPAGALDGINTGIVRLRTANMRLDWENTSLIVGQDSLFISPNSPTSFASLLVPSLGYSGNLWAWTPQVRLEHKFNLNDDQTISVQGGILDNVTGEPSYGTHRQPQAGEASGQPAFAARTAWTRNMNGKPLILGASGYYSRQNWGQGWTVDGWAAVGDWRIPVYSRLELSGEFYRGKSIGGLGGGIGQSVLFRGSPNSFPDFVPLNSIGGWSQLKFTATSRLEFNGAFGADNPFARDIHSLWSPVGIYPSVLTANRSEMLNFIYRPRSDLLLSAEYRHLRTSQIGNYYSADHVNLMMGVLF